MEKKIKNCDRCLRFKAVPQKTSLCPLKITHPLELIHMDYLKIESNQSDKDVHILIVTDHFTRFTQAFITPNETAPVVAKTLWDQYFMKYGILEKIISDQGRNFESKLIAELCNLATIQKLCTSPYRPQTNGQCECFNSTLISMIGTLPPDTKRNWQAQRATLVHGYNCTKSSATGYKPYTLIFGWEPLLPIDIEFRVQTPDITAVMTHKYVEKLRNKMKWAFKKATEISLKESARQKRYYNKKIKCSQLKTGDLVLVHQKGFKGKHKIQDKWENIPYKVVKQKSPNLPILLVENIENPTKTRVLHRNMLFPLLTQNLDHKDTVTNTVSEDKESESLGLEENSCKGPMIRSRTKGTTTPTVDIAVKANQEMKQHFELDSKSVELDFNPNYPDLFAHIEAGFTSIRRWLMYKFH